MIAVIAGLATLIGLNVVSAFAYGFACAHSQFFHVLLRFSVLSWPIKMAVWFGCAWAGLSVWEALA